MILTRLIEPIGCGSSRLRGVVKRGLSFIRQVLQGEKRHPVSEQSLVRLICPPLPVRDRVVSTVKRGAREILSRYLARNRFQDLAAEMRNRYAFLMSSPVRASPVFRNRIAIYGFVGLSFGSAVGSRVAPGVVEDDYEVRVVKELLKWKPRMQVVSKDCGAVNEQEAFSEQRSISGESDFTVVLSDDESDFEILESTEVCVIEADSDSIIYGMELQESIELDTHQNLSKENRILREIVTAQANKEKLLKTELVRLLTSVDDQQKELVMLRDSVQRQNLSLRTQLYSNPSTVNHFNGTGENSRLSRTPRDLDCESRCLGSSGSRSSTTDPEKLRAAGGRVRALKIHRKQRLKNN